jgi:hypothetical protein
VIALYLRQRSVTRRGVVSWVIQPLIGLAVIVWLLTHLDVHALTAGAIWLVVGFGWLLYLTRMLREPPPEMTFSEAE